MRFASISLLTCYMNLNPKYYESAATNKTTKNKITHIARIFPMIASGFGNFVNEPPARKYLLGLELTNPTSSSFWCLSS